MARQHQAQKASNQSHGPASIYRHLRDPVSNSINVMAVSSLIFETGCFNVDNVDSDGWRSNQSDNIQVVSKGKDHGQPVDGSGEGSETLA